MKQRTLRMIRNDLVKKLSELDLYKVQFDHAIDTLTHIIFDYEKSWEEFESSGEEMMIPYTNKAGATNISKNPKYAAVESLRRDMLDYLRELGLTPSALKRIREESMKPKGKPSGFEAMLAGVMNDA